VIGEIKNSIATFQFLGLRRADRARAAIGCQTAFWSGFKFAPNARRYKAQGKEGKGPFGLQPMRYLQQL